MWAAAVFPWSICSLVACVIFHTVAYRYLMEILMLETCWSNLVRAYRVSCATDVAGYALQPLRHPDYHTNV